MRTLSDKIWWEEKEAEKEETEQKNKFGRLIIRASVIHIVEVSNITLVNVKAPVVATTNWWWLISALVVA